MLVGNVAINVNSHALNQVENILLTKLIFKILITNDIKHDVCNTMENVNTCGVSFF